jgi:hypothetical protein
MAKPSDCGPWGRYLVGMQHFTASTTPDNLLIQPGMLRPVSRKASSSVKWLQFLSCYSLVVQVVIPIQQVIGATRKRVG